MNPASLRYAETHEWVALEGDVATIGITKFAVEQLTDLVYVELPAAGRKLRPQEPFGEIESVKAVSDLYAPVAGEVIEVNASVKSDAMNIAADPYGSGWLIKLRVPGGTTLDHLLTLEQYEQQIAEEHP
jgi:glycine cleavage system H protein